jgi:hypothetical protein
MKIAPAVVPLIASGLTVLAIVVLVAVAAGGTSFVLEIALAVMVAGFAMCFWMIQHLDSRRDAERAGADAEETTKVSAHDLPLDNPARPDMEYAEHAPQR